MKPASFLALCFALSAVLLREPCQAKPAKSQLHATLQGNVVRLEPSKFTFRIPQDWVHWNESSSKSLHLSRQEIDKVENAEGEWDKPFSQIVNSIFPIERCAAHVGSEGWGADAVAFSDVQMRAYVVASSVTEIEATIKKSGMATASKFSRKVTLGDSRLAQWRISNLSYELWYGDYGGTAHIDVYTRMYGKQTIALVFMYTDYPSDQRDKITQIVQSFKGNK